jgi:hypothetical protein
MLFSPVYTEAHPRRNAAFASRMNLRDAGLAALAKFGRYKNSIIEDARRKLGVHE